MVFTREQQKKFAPALNISDYMIVKTDVLMFSEDRIRLRLAISIVDVLNIVGILDRTFDEIGASKKLDTSIMHEVLVHLLKDHDPSLEQDELIKYFTFKQQLEKHNCILDRFTDLSSNNLPYELDFVLLGLSLEDYFFLEEDFQAEGLHTEYSRLNSKLVYRKGSVEEHIKEAKMLIKDCEKKVEEAA